MNIRQIYSLELSKENIFPNRFSIVPSSILDWMEENQREGFIVWDEEDQICYASNSIKYYLGYNHDELIGKKWKDILEIHHMSEIETNLAEESKSKRVFEICPINENNKEIWIEFTTEKIKDNHTGESFYAGVMREITESKTAKEMKIQAEKMAALGQMSAGIAHEIRNPLTSLKGFLQLLQAGVNYKEEYYKIMADEIEKMESITSELLFMSKPATNDMKMESVNQMIREISLLLQSQARLKNIIIHTEKNITEMEILCDSSQIKQVLINLIKNAIEAMNGPGEIKVYSQTTENEVRICVEDEGIGLPEELAEQLGKPFFTTKKHGTGLGLSISKEIIELHGGTLLYSKNKTKGSTFKMVFPKN